MASGNSAVVKSRGPEITVKLMGKAAELVRSRDKIDDSRVVGIRTRLAASGTTTPRKIVAQIAEENPLLRDQIVRSDGSPRSSTRILLNGQAPADLDQELEIREDENGVPLIVIIFGDGTVVVITDVVIIVIHPCDG